MYEEGSRFGRIDLPFAKGIADGYNTSKVEVMQNEYIYKAQVKRFWVNIEVWKGLTLPVYYDGLYALISKLDEDIHATNILGITLDSLYK
jgi:hypothetical protein